MCIRVILLLAAALAAAPARAQTTARASVSSSGLQAQGHSTEAAISANGRWIAFASDAGNLAPGDTNGRSDVFVHDRQDGSTERVSLDENGAEFNGQSWAVALSADGGTVAFELWVVPFPGYNATSLYVRDWQGAASQLVASHGMGGEFEPALSQDGRFLAYDFLEDVFNPSSSQVYVLDRQSGAAGVVSVSSAGVKGGNPSACPSISADGRYVAFLSHATNLVPGDTNGFSDIFVHDRSSGATVLASVAYTGGPANGASRRPAISADGRWIAFESTAKNLVPGSGGGIFVHDRLSGTTVLASLATSGALANGESHWPSISSDGTRVLFGSYATNLVPGDTNATADVFLRDLALGTTERASVDSAGQEGDGQSWPLRGSLSADGLRMGFHSQAKNLVAGDTNNAFDVFVHDLTLACPPLATYCTAKANSLGCAPTIGASGLPELTGNDAFFVVAERVLSNKIGMLFWGLAPASTPFAGGTLCIQQPLVRTPIQPSGGNPPPDDCSGTYSFHFSQAYMAANGLAPGTSVYAQYWSRDPGFAPPQNIGLTDALSFTTCP